MTEPSPFHRFDAAAAWAAMDDAQRADIGIHALEIALVWHLQDLEGPGPESALPPIYARVASAADDILLSSLETLVRDCLPDDAFTAPDGSTPRVPSLVGGICRRCGCTHFDPCAEGCAWSAEDLCTVCAGPA